MRSGLAAVLLVTATAASARAVQAVSFDAKASSAVEARRTKNGLLLVRPLFDGKPVGWFLFDSGAAHCIDKSVAKRLELPSAGAVTARSATAMIETVRRRLGSMQLGPAIFVDVRMTEIDLAYLSKQLGQEIVGLIGIEVMDACVVKIDRSEARIDLFDPKLHEPKVALWHPVIRRHQLACIKVQIEGQSETLKIDTGLDSPMLIYPAAAKRLKLLEGHPAKTAEGGTVDGATRFKVVPISSLKIGKEDIGGLYALVSQAKAGAMADDKIAGLLGGQILDYFVLVMDLPRERVGFVLKSADDPQQAEDRD